MKVGILTYYDVHNHGAVLQANALKTVIMSLGHDCEFLSFDRDYSMIPQKQANKYKISLKSIPFYLNYLYEKGIGNIAYNINKNRILDKYRKDCLPIGERYDAFQGDVAVIGSDEVFSLEIGVNPFLYGNDLKAKKIISYAGCFGPTTYKDIEESNLKDMISNGFLKMNAISVRDKNSQDIAKSVSGKNAELVCDPVILYGYKDEMDEFIPPLKDYIVIYSYDKNMNLKEETDRINKYAQDNNLKILSVGYYHKWCRNIQANPIELLGWIKNAKLVITDTFHGSVMSIICNTPMIVKIRGNKNKLSFLLDEYGLSDRIIEDFSKIDEISKQDIDFSEVNKLLEKRRKKSEKFLIDALRS